MKKTQRINLASFKAESWPVAIRPARLRKSLKPDRVLQLDARLALVTEHTAKPESDRATRLGAL